MARPLALALLVLAGQPPSSSQKGSGPSACPAGSRSPEVLCGHLLPQAYISALQSGPGKVYTSLRRHPALFDAQASAAGWPLAWLAPAVRTALQVGPSAARADALAALLEPESDGVWSIALFSTEFCRMFLEEVDSYRSTGLPTRRVNSMNRYGLIVNEIGMHAMISVLQRTILQPIAAKTYPVEGSAFDKHHSFVVQ